MVDKKDIKQDLSKAGVLGVNVTPETSKHKDEIQKTVDQKSKSEIYGPNQALKETYTKGKDQTKTVEQEPSSPKPRGPGK